MCGVEEIFGVALAATGKTQTVQTITGEVELPANDRASEIPTTEAMSELATRVMRNWRTNVDHRMTSGVDAKLKKALLAQTCNYTAEQKAKLRKAGVSEDIYSPITNTKVRAAKALLMDIFNANGDYPFCLRPTANPDMPQEIVDRVMAEMERQIEQVISSFAVDNGQPLPPEHEQLLNQAIIAVTSNMYDEMQSRIEGEAKNRAKRMEKRVQDYFDEGGFVDAFQQYVDYICTYGTGLICGPVPRVVPVNVFRKKKGVPRYVRELRVVPTFEAVNPFDCYPAPMAKDIDDGPLCIRVSYSSNELNRCATKAKSKRTPDDKANGWLWHTVKALLDRYPDGGCKITTDPVDAERRAAEKSGPENPNDCMLEGVKCYDSVRGSELIDLGILRDRIGKLIKFDEFYEVETIVIGGYVVYCRILDDRLGRPVVKGVFYELPGSWWGESIADKLALVQSTMNNAVKALFRNMAAASGPMYWINDVSRLVDRDGTGAQVRAHKVFLFQPSMSTSLGTSSGAPMGVMDVPSKASELLAVWEKMKTQADDDSGIPAYTYGQAGGNSGAMRTAQGLAIFTEAASRGMKMVISTTDRLVTRKLVKKTVDYILLYDPDFEIKGDCEVVPTGIMGKILRAQQDMQRMQFVQLIQRDPDFKQLIGPKGWTALLRPMITDIAMNPDEILPSVERLKTMEQLQELKMIFAAQNGAAQAEQPAAEAPEGDMGGDAPAPGSVAERRGAA